MSINGGNREVKAYQLLEVSQFNEPTITYDERVRTNISRSHPYGFYHGMIVSHGKSEYVLSGSPLIFVASNEPVLQ